MNRAQLSIDLASLRPTLTALQGQLQASPDWYASVYVERRASQSFAANLKQTRSPIAPPW